MRIIQREGEFSNSKCTKVRKESVWEIEMPTAFIFSPINNSSHILSLRTAPAQHFKLLMFLHRMHRYPEYFRASFPRVYPRKCSVEQRAMGLGDHMPVKVSVLWKYIARPAWKAVLHSDSFSFFYPSSSQSNFHH